MFESNYYYNESEFNSFDDIQFKQDYSSFLQNEQISSQPGREYFTI
jgi:hypothetical protein